MNAYSRHVPRPWRSFVGAAALCFSAFFALTPSLASAQADLPELPSDPYRQHMDNGVRLFEAKNYKAAIAEFDEAYKVKPKASPLVNIALCHKAEFRYPKAIAALEQALERHGDAMEESDKTAVKREIEEMKALLSYVTFLVTPRTATVVVDGEAVVLSPPKPSEGSPDRPAAPAPVQLSPGPHVIRVSAEGHDTLEDNVSLASGQRTLTYALKQTMERVRVRAAGQNVAIAIDQKAVGYGVWEGWVSPGPHVVQMYVPGSTTPPYAMRIEVAIGKPLDVAPGKGGTPILGGTTFPAIPPPPKPPAKPVTGFFILGTFSLFGPLDHPRSFQGEQISPGVSIGLRGGYRVNTPVSFDLQVEYANILTKKAQEESVQYNLETLRIGANMRLQTPGRSARFYGSFGGGLVYESLEFAGNAKNEMCAEGLATCKNSDGYDAYFSTEAGLQFSLGNVLLDLALGVGAQSTRNFQLYTYGDLLPFLHGGVRVGYAWW